MNNGEEKNGNDFYAVLGLKKECTSADLRNAYKKLAMRWHPDRCSSSGNSKYLEEAKMKFQAIQEAYSVLSDDHKRLLYDVGLHNDEDDENGMEDFMSEMADIMNQNKCNGIGHNGSPYWYEESHYLEKETREQHLWVCLQDNRNESLEDLQDLFVEMFQSDLGAFVSPSNNAMFSSPASLYSSCGETLSATHKRNSSETNTGKSHGIASSFDAHFEGFCLGMGGTSGKWQDGGRKNDRNLRSRRK